MTEKLRDKQKKMLINIKPPYFKKKKQCYLHLLSVSRRDYENPQFGLTYYFVISTYVISYYDFNEMRQFVSNFHRNE